MSLRDHPFQLSYGPSEDLLHDFYVPALSASIGYDRMAGFFSSSALAVAAAGVAHLIASGGHMRLLVGAQLSAQDVEAIREGGSLSDIVAARLDAALPDPESLADELMRDRLAALAWMVATGKLEIRVVLPKGGNGLPLASSDSRDYFHPKVGIFTDSEAGQLAFSGSVNESETGWRHNYEQFMVFRSWTEEGPLYIAELVGRFQRLWERREPDWIALPVPEAARQKLLRYAPSQAPARDPLERAEPPVREGPPQVMLSPAEQEERVLFQFLRDAPQLVGGAGLAAATSAISPWPHQHVVANRVAGSFPCRYLLADEVGLGKTIEAGLVLRQLYLRGIVRRVLILAPKSVLRQWQEELHEKFVLNVPIYDGTLYRDALGNERVAGPTSPWDDAELVLASSQLVKRRDRRDILLAARPWDLVVVDEAHHARRRDLMDLTRYRPNRLLELLNDLADRTRGLVLMTATPMQLHPIELWDLLQLLGLAGEWGSDGEVFLRFYEELGRARTEADWAFVFRLVGAELEMGDAQLERGFEAGASKRLTSVQWERVRRLLSANDPGRAFRALPDKAQSVAMDLARQHTPLRRLVFRNTRDVLRAYVRDGLLKEKVPTRDPEPVWITMRAEERELYDRIEQYISRFYHRYEGERKGLGFVMTVYRRRLTSSFYAVQRSLERRLAFLRGETDVGLVDDDLEQEALSEDVDELRQEDRALFSQEIAYVEEFVHDLGLLGGHDSKVAQLTHDVREIFRTRDTVLVFTQYTDTMDFLREQLRQVYGSNVACYSGRGGERWDGVMWVPVTKEEVKNDFRKGELKILLCTEAASEGLNLQTCGELINYDMPWNPMRVEQRIGRIDRIGQVYDRVSIRNYFYQDTIEARVYQALSRRIGWFQHVVGPLQPILAQVGRVIEEVAMAPEEDRERTLQERLSRLQTQLDEPSDAPNLDDWAGHAEGTVPLDTPLTLPELAATLISSPAVRGSLRAHESIENAFWLTHGDEEVPVTFDPATYDRHPNTLQLLSYGNPLLETVLARVPEPDDGEHLARGLLRLQVHAPLPRVAYYRLKAKAKPECVNTLADLRTALGEPTPEVDWSDKAIREAGRDLVDRVEDESAALAAAEQRVGEARRSGQVARAALLLIEAALVELALGQQPELLQQETFPSAFDDNAVIGLKRHGYPWTALLRLAAGHLQTPHASDPFFAEVRGESAEQLKRRFNGLAQRAARLLEDFAAATADNAASVPHSQ